MNEVKKSKEMTAALQSKAVRDWVQQRLNTEDKNQTAARYRIEHLDASSKVAQRENAKAQLMGATAEKPHAVLNVGLFGEGVDVPGLSAVGFLEPRKSPVEVIQAVGRVMRRAQHKKMGYILCPIIIPPKTDAEQWLSSSNAEDGWQELGQILVALRAHDRRIEDELANLIQIYLPPPPTEEIATLVALGTEDNRVELYKHQGQPGTAEADTKKVLTGQAQIKDLPYVLEDPTDQPIQTAEQRIYQLIENAADPEPAQIISGKKNADGSLELRTDAPIRLKTKDTMPGPIDIEKTKKHGRKMLNGEAGQPIKPRPQSPREDIATLIALGGKNRISYHVHIGKPGTAQRALEKVLANHATPKNQFRPLSDLTAANPPAETPEQILSGKLTADGNLELRKAKTIRLKPPAENTPAPLDLAKSKKLGRQMLAGKAGEPIDRNKLETQIRGLFDQVEADKIGITANLLAKSGLATNRPQRDTNILEHSITEAKRRLAEDELAPLLDRHFRLDQLAAEKRKQQADGPTIAALLLMNACLLHQRIAAGGWLPNIAALDQIKNAPDAIMEVFSQWNRITRHDFLPIVEPAIEIIEAIQTTGKRSGLNSALRHLAAQAEQIAASYADLGADHAGPLFNKVMGNQASDGAYFTRPPAAALLAALTLDAADKNADWTKDSTWKEYRTVDLACGSGTLLAALLTEMKRRARVQGATDERLAELQKLAVEETLAGLDFNPVSLQLAAAQLTAGNQDVAYRRMQLYQMPYGPEAGRARVGTPELLGQRKILRRAGFDFADEKVGQQVQLDRDDPLLEDAVDAASNVRTVIMNPPFTNRKKMGEKFAKEIQQEMRLRIDSYEKMLVAADPEMENLSGQNSIAPMFVALADKCADQKQGIMAMIHPTIALTNIAGQNELRILAKRFHVHSLITCHDPKQINLSQNTSINESLIILRRHHGLKPPTRIIALDRFPANETEATELHKHIENTKTGLLPDGWGEISEWPAERIEKGDYSAVAFRSPELADAAAKIAGDKRLPLMPDQSVFPQLAGAVPSSGFEKCPANTENSFPVLYSKSADGQKKIESTPDAHMVFAKKINAGRGGGGRSPKKTFGKVIPFARHLGPKHQHRPPNRRRQREKIYRRRLDASPQCHPRSSKSNRRLPKLHRRSPPTTPQSGSQNGFPSIQPRHL